MQIKTTMKYYLTFVIMAIIKKNYNKCWRECGKAILVYWWLKCKLVHPLWKTIWRILKNLKIELSHNPACPSLGIYQGKENTNLKGYMQPIVHNYIK